MRAQCRTLNRLEGRETKEEGRSTYAAMLSPCPRANKIVSGIAIHRALKLKGFNIS